MQPVDLHDVHEIDDFGHQRVDEQRAHLAGVEKHHPGVDRGHAQTHRDHQQWFKYAFRAKINQNEPEQHQEDSPDHDFRFGGNQGRNALEEVEEMKGFHGGNPERGCEKGEEGRERQGLLTAPSLSCFP